jgi:SAM-dependent methyltransferase
VEAALRQPNMTDVYEGVLVPAIFAPWSAELIERARPIGPSDRILDLGCGTGIVARKLRERLGGAADITGLDASAEMIAKARELAPELTWHEGNAMSLPFPDASFELVVCQQMLQFVPDRAVALREIRRVLVRGGRLVLATWRPRHELALYEALGRVAERHLGAPNEKRFALGDDGELRALLSDAGFSSVAVEIISRAESFKEFPFRLSALAANFDLSGLPDEERERRLRAVEFESIEASKPFVAGGRIEATSRANIATAVAT